jgi:hypothetical protein
VWNLASPDVDFGLLDMESGFAEWFDFVIG